MTRSLFCLIGFLALLHVPAWADSADSDAPDIPPPEGAIEGIPSGGRWVVGIDSPDEPWRVILQDMDTERVFQLLDFPPGTPIKVDWIDQNTLEVREKKLKWEIALMEPEEEGGVPRVLVVDEPGTNRVGGGIAGSMKGGNPGNWSKANDDFLRRTEIIVDRSWNFRWRKNN